MTSKAKGGGKGAVRAILDALPAGMVSEQEVQDKLQEHHGNSDAAFMDLQRSKDQWNTKPKRDKPKKADPRADAQAIAAPMAGRGAGGRGRGAPGGRGAGRGGGRDSQGFEGGRRGRRDGPPGAGGPPRPPRRDDTPAQAPAPAPVAKTTGGGGLVVSSAAVGATPLSTGMSFAEMLSRGKPSAVQPAQDTAPPVASVVPAQDAAASFAENQGVWGAGPSNTDPVVPEPEVPQPASDPSDGWGQPGPRADSPVSDKEDLPSQHDAPVPTEPEVADVPAAADPPVPEAAPAAPHQPSPYRPQKQLHEPIAAAPALEPRHAAQRSYRPRATGPDVALPDSVQQWAGGDSISFGFAPSAAPELGESMADPAVPPQSSTPTGGTPNMPPQLPPALPILPGNDHLSLVPPQNPAAGQMQQANGSARQQQSMAPSQPSQGHSQVQYPHQQGHQQANRQQQHGRPQQGGQGFGNSAVGGQGQGQGAPQGQGQGMQEGMQQYPSGPFGSYDASSMGFPNPSANGNQMPGGADFYPGQGAQANSFGPGFGGPQFNAPQASRQGGKQGFGHGNEMGKQGMNAPHPHVSNMPGGQQASQYQYPMAHYPYQQHLMMHGQYPMPHFPNPQARGGGYGGYSGYPQGDYSMMQGYPGYGYGDDGKMGQGFYNGSAGQDQSGAPAGKGFTGTGSAGNAQKSQQQHQGGNTPAKQEMGASFGGFYGQAGPQYQPAGYAAGGN